MKCVNPRRLPNPGATNLYDAFIQTSCGKCYACLANRRRSWLFRLQNENLNSVISLFVTLTYDEYNVLRERGQPSNLLLCKKDLQDFIKRMRAYETFTYYAIGEYGTNTHRPHYHLAMFFKSAPAVMPLDALTFLINDKWSFGFVSVSRVSYRRLNYVLHYHTRPKQIDGKPTFQLFSKGLGIDFINEDMIKYLCDSKKTTIKDYNGNTYVIPRYYRKKLKEQGYDVDPPEPVIWKSDNSVEVIEKVFKKPIWQIPSYQIAEYLTERKRISFEKIKKFNNQDKFK